MKISAIEGTMESFLINNFIEVLGGTILVLSLILGLLSLIPCWRFHTIKLLAIFVVAALTLFSNHWSTYFAGIFVIATAVTELDFLQNLAAIIRGNTAYFDYKKESLSFDQKQKKIEEEQKQFNKAESMEGESKENHIKADNQESITIKSDIGRIINIEEKALNGMEKYFNSKIERGVRIRGNGKHIELDGLIPSIVDDVVSEKIIEIKYLKSPSFFSAIERIFPQIENIARTYSQITNKIAKLHIVLVVEGEQGLSDVQLLRLKQLIDSSNIAMGYSIFTTKQLGIE